MSRHLMEGNLIGIVYFIKISHVYLTRPHMVNN
jgi:hypothetical protein